MDAAPDRGWKAGPAGNLEQLRGVSHSASAAGDADGQGAALGRGSEDHPSAGGRAQGDGGGCRNGRRPASLVRVHQARGSRGPGALLTLMAPSLIVQPADGRIPALTPSAKEQVAFNRAHEFDSWVNMDPGDRCLFRGILGNMLPTFYNNSKLIATPFRRPGSLLSPSSGTTTIGFSSTRVTRETTRLRLR